jgi:hypothetical protein
MVKTSAVDIHGSFDKSCRYNRPVQYGRDATCAFRSLEVYMYERQHYL